MRCYINDRYVDAAVIRHGSLETRGGKNIRPILVRHEGAEVWVYDDEGDARLIPGDRGPCRGRAAPGDPSWA